MNALGYRLLELKRARDAVEIFKLNAAAHPNSANAYDSLGEAYMKSGDGEAAIRSYRRALELNPRSRNAADMLRKLEQRQ